MKEIYLVKDTPANKISYLLLLVFLLTLPFNRFYSELVLISLLAHTIIQLPAQKRIPFQPYLFLPALVYVLTVAGSLYSNDKEQALKDCEKQLALVLFPLIFYTSPLDFEKYKLRLLKAFGIICSLLILYLFYEALQVIRYNKLPISAMLSHSLTNHNFSVPLGLHATYFSMFISLSLLVFMYLFLSSNKTGVQILYASGCIILFAGLLQLASRSVFLATLLIINLAVPLFLLQKEIRKKYIFLSLLLTALIIGSFTTTSSFKSRYLIMLKQDLTMAGVPHNISEPRLKRWYYMGRLIRQHPLIGFGSGTEVNLLKKNYYEHRLYNSFLHELNADNQYISLLLKNGIVGLFTYITVLFLGFRYSIRTNDFFFFSFLVIISIVSLSENILDVNKGIFFFSFFFSLFVKGAKKNYPKRNVAPVES